MFALRGRGKENQDVERVRRVVWMIKLDFLKKVTGRRAEERQKKAP